MNTIRYTAHDVDCLPKPNTVEIVVTEQLAPERH